MKTSSLKILLGIIGFFIVYSYYGVMSMTPHATPVAAPTPPPMPTPIAQYEQLGRVRIVVQEWAYFEGQKDAINGDIRISKQPNGHYSWAKSCWDDGQKPIFNPYITEDEAAVLQSLTNEP